VLIFSYVYDNYFKKWHVTYMTYGMCYPHWRKGNANR
jgi:hypothetical protein